MNRNRVWVLFFWLALCAPPATYAEFGGQPGYAGSDTCAQCHPDVYAQWRLTPHARMPLRSVVSKSFPVTLTGIEIVTVRDGRISRRWGEWDPGSGD